MPSGTREIDRMTRLCRCALSLALVALGFADPAHAQLPVKKFATADGKRPNGLFAPGVMVGKTLYVAGKGDYRPDAEFPDKVRNCLTEVRKVLQTAGLDMRHVVKSFVYLEDPDKYAEMNKYYAEFFPDSPPARTTLGVAQVPGESRVEITCIAYSYLAERKPIGTPRPGFPYTPGILAGDTLYVSGKGDQLPEGGHPATFDEQVRQSLRNVEATLKQAGLDFRNVVMSHVFLDKAENIEVADRVYNEFFEDGKEPACATVVVDWIPGGSHVEVTCIATTDLASRKIVRPGGSRPEAIEGCVSASPAVWAGNTLYLSALPGCDLATRKMPADLKEQVHQMARNHVAILDAAGLKLDDIVSGNVYLRDMADYQDMNAVYREYFSKGPGVRTCLMPGAVREKETVRVQASFIAARTSQP
jgi:2-iminobutanoate/2-iminopropanoate deaminase